MNPVIQLNQSTLFLNRELSQLDFNFRVLAQALDPTVPLLERLRFLCISSTNLDEFFEIRVATLRHAQELGLPPHYDGLTASQILAIIYQRTNELVQAQYDCWNNILRLELIKNNIGVLDRKEWNHRQTQWLRAYFHKEIMPVLSPLGLDPVHPFPRIFNKSLNFIVVLKGKGAFGNEGDLAIVRTPRSLPRVIPLPSQSKKGQQFVLLSSVLWAFIDELFPGMEVQGAYPFRVTRNSELVVDEEEVENLASALRDELIGRGYRPAVRLEITENCPQPIIDTLLQNFDLTENAVYKVKGPVNLSRITQLYELAQRPDLKYPILKQRNLKSVDCLFELVAKRDILLHHPFDAFNPVLELLRQAAIDPNVLAIKQTLYRTGKDSSIVEALIQAANNGKDVTVVVELRARFDEEANLGLADRLQEAGVQVMYGVVGYKTHAKMLLIVRREGRKLRRYVHLGTGNYHSGTAKAYTDLGLITAHPDIGHDVHQLFQQLSGLAPAIELKCMLQAPFTLHAGILQKIQREADNARQGKPAQIIAKLNALNEPQVINALYQASQAGVDIQLIVRGACTLRPGLEGVSENIHVRSIIGQFLEHSRVYWFNNNNNPELYCASADWLERNLLRRVETCFPILDKKIAQRIYTEVLENYLKDNTNAWILQSDGTYQKAEEVTEKRHSAQNYLLSIM